MGSAARSEPARDEERAAALSLLFQDLPVDERRARVAGALELVRSGELNPAGIFVQRSQAKITGVIVCLPVPGAGGLVWPPRVVQSVQRQEREDELVQHARDWLRSQGVKLAQCLLAREETSLAGPLERNGFAHVTHLWYLQNDLQGGSWPEPSALEYVAYGPGSAKAFHETLLRTYIDTLDCPEVSGVRSLEEILGGHRAQGVVPAEGWLLATASGQPVGVSLVAALPANGGWELTYIGIVPESRRHGYGAQMVANVLRRAQASGVNRVTLSVDGRNWPALALYQRLSFAPIERREVYLASWR